MLYAALGAAGIIGAWSRTLEGNLPVHQNATMKIFLPLLFFPLLALAHPLDGRIWDTQTKSFVSAETVYQRAAASRFLLLGELHDSSFHHRLQREALEALSRHGRKPALALEQFDSEHQAALDAARQSGIREPEQLAEAGRFDRDGWSWPLYRELIGHAAKQGWPLLAANLSRSATREIARGNLAARLPPASDKQIRAIEQEIIEGHCKQRPEEGLLQRMVTAQRARDAHMAAILEGAGSEGAVLIAGASHVRRDSAVPRYLAAGSRSLVIGYVEVHAGEEAPESYATDAFDIIWFTPAEKRDDPCLGFVAPGAPQAAAAR